MSSRLDQYRSSIFGNNSSVHTPGSNRDSQLQNYLRNQSIARASLSRRELQQHTDVKFFVSSNFANFASLVCVLAVTWCLGWMSWGRDTKGSYREISGKYETLLTPQFWVIPAIWGLVFITESFFILFSFLSDYSHLPIVQKGVGFHFFYVNCFQLGWIISYCFDMVWLATIWMSINVIFLIWLNFNLYYQGYINPAPRGVDQSRTLPQSRPDEVDHSTPSISTVYEWLVFRLPFQLHLGWGIFVLLLNWNETAISLNWGASANIAIVSIIILWIVGIFVLFYPKSPVFAVPLIISFAVAGVWINLSQPSKEITQQYDALTISRMYGGIIATCIEHALISCIRYVFFFANSYSIMEK